MRDLTELKGMELGIKDARMTLSEPETVQEYWQDRQINWKARMCDVRRIAVEGDLTDRAENLFENLWTRGWPLLEIDEEKNLVKIGYEEPAGSVWIWVEHYWLDDSSLIPEDDPYVVKTYGGLLVA